MSLDPGWATASFILMMACIFSSLLIMAYLSVCYFPGGRHKEGVIEVQNYSLYLSSIFDAYETEECEAVDRRTDPYYCQSKSSIEDNSFNSSKVISRNMSSFCAFDLKTHFLVYVCSPL